MKLRAYFLLGGMLTLLWSALPTSQTVPARAATLAAAGPAARASAFNEGMAYLRAGNYKRAEQAFRQAIAQNDHLLQAYVGLGEAALSLRDYMTAFRAFKAAAGRDAKDAEVEYKTAYSALYAQDYHAAISYATAFIKLQPHNWKGYHLRFLADGDLLLRKDQVRDAGMVVKLNPHSATAYNDYGISLANVRRLKESIRALSRAIALDPRSALFYMNRGVAENLNNQPRLALRDLQKARSLTRDPSLKGRLDAAIKYLKTQLHIH